MWIPITGIIFGCAIPIVAIIFEHFTKKSKMRVMEKAIENGISPEDMSLEDKKRPRVPYRSGMISLAVGLGIGIFSFVIGKIEMDVFHPLLGIASIPILVGIALIINDKINYDRLFNKEPDTQ
jgi:hypothetical protein